MNTHDSEPDELDLLEAEINELIQAYPERRAVQQNIRAAFAVAEAFDDLIDSNPRQLEDIAEEVGLQLDEIRDILNATPRTPPTIELILKLARSLGYRFEVQFFPIERLNEVKSRDHELTGDGILGGVLIRFSDVIEPRTIRASLIQGVRRLASKAERNRAVKVRLENQLSRISLLKMLDTLREGTTTISELVNISDSISYKLQLRFVPSVPYEASNVEAERTTSSRLGIYHGLGARYKTISS